VTNCGHSKFAIFSGKYTRQNLKILRADDQNWCLSVAVVMRSGINKVCILMLREVLFDRVGPVLKYIC
jgi:hypothetical protein